MKTKAEWNLVDLIDLIDHSEYVDAGDSITKVDLFFKRNAHEFAAVVREGITLGLCSRSQIQSLLGDPDQIAFHQQKPVGENLLPHCVFVQVNERIQDVLNYTLSRSCDYFFQDVVLIDSDRGFLGLISTHSLVSAQSILMNEQFRIVAEQERRRKQADRDQTFLASIVESSDDGIVGTETDGSIRTWNRGAEKLFGYKQDEVIGKSVKLLFPANQESEYLNATVKRITHQERSERFEAIRISKDGTPIEVSIILTQIRDDLGNLQGVSGNYRDIRNRKKMEQERGLLDLQLRQAQKLESVGRLAAGVAHEINTPVQFVSDSVYFVQDGIKELFGLIGEYRTACEAARSGTNIAEIATRIKQVEDDIDMEYLLEQMPKALTRALDGVGRVAEIVRSMKEFAHPDQTEKTTVDLNRYIASTLIVARNEYKYVADLETEYGDIPQVFCHAGEINQVILNIIVNASHAITDVVKGTDRRGTIRVRTWCEDSEAVISIEDTGGGMPPEIRDRIFDPFFTTKEIGRGTGQGLAIARSVIVDKHCGTIECDSISGQGTTFVVRLPIDGSAVSSVVKS